MEKTPEESPQKQRLIPERTPEEQAEQDRLCRDYAQKFREAVEESRREKGEIA